MGRVVGTVTALKKLEPKAGSFSCGIVLYFLEDLVLGSFMST